MKYVLSVGTNIGERKKNIIDCENAINLVPYTDVIDSSSIYETEPLGYARQQSFYNVIFLVESVLDPHEMLGVCLGIESGFGRIRTVKNGPRIIDIDIIFAENQIINTRNLAVPHPRYTLRRFVLEPMLELFPSGEFCGIEFKHCLNDIDGQCVRRLED